MRDEEKTISSLILPPSSFLSLYMLIAFMILIEEILWIIPKDERIIRRDLPRAFP